MNPAVEALKPCPSCGRSARRLQNGCFFKVQCTNELCALRTRGFISQALADECWNRRAQAEQTPVADEYAGHDQFKEELQKAIDLLSYIGRHDMANVVMTAKRTHSQSLARIAISDAPVAGRVISEELAKDLDSLPTWSKGEVAVSDGIGWVSRADIQSLSSALRAAPMVVAQPSETVRREGE